MHEEFVHFSGSNVELRKLPRWYRPHAAAEQYAPGRKPEWLRNRIILIVDDVITTGSTIRAMAKGLLELQAREVCAIAVAHTEGVRLKRKVTCGAP